MLTRSRAKSVTTMAPSDFAKSFIAALQDPGVAEALSKRIVAPIRQEYTDLSEQVASLTAQLEEQNEFLLSQSKREQKLFF